MHVNKPRLRMSTKPCHKVIGNLATTAMEKICSRAASGGQAFVDIVGGRLRKGVFKTKMRTVCS